MDKNNLVNIIRKNEDKPFLSLTRLAEKFENQPYGAKVAELLLGGGATLFGLTSCSGTVIPEPPGPVEENKIEYDVPLINSKYLNDCMSCSAKMAYDFFGLGNNLTLKELWNIYTPGGDDSMAVVNFMNHALSLGYDLFKEEKLGFDEIYNELKKGNLIIYQSDFSLTDSTDHASLITGIDLENEMLYRNDSSLGKVKEDFDTVRERNYQWSMGTQEECWGVVLWPKDKAIKDTKDPREKAIQIVNSQIDSILGKPEF